MDKTLSMSEKNSLTLDDALAIVVSLSGGQSSPSVKAGDESPVFFDLVTNLSRLFFDVANLEVSGGRSSTPAASLIDFVSLVTLLSQNSNDPLDGFLIGLPFGDRFAKNHK